MQGNYSLENIEERVEQAKKGCSKYLKGLEDIYEERKARRIKFNLPVIAVCGMGRAGKDTAAEYLCDYGQLYYPRSASWIVLPIISKVIGIDNQDAWDERHDHREFWIKACHAFRGKDYGLLVRMCLSAGDIVVGVRGKLELESVVKDKLVDITLWIDNPRVPKDITVEYGPEDCDLMIPNYGSLLEFYSKLNKFLMILEKDWFKLLKRN